MQSLKSNQLSEIERIKQEIDRFRPFSPHIVNELRRYFRISLTWSSNAIEGNTLTESETKAVLEDGLTIGGKQMREHLEVLGHGDAFDSMWSLISETTLTAKDICELHRLFYVRIDPANAGVYRKVPVLITGTDYIPPEPSKIPDQMRSLDQWLATEALTLHPVQRGIEAHIRLVNIHPFVDGNGRTARLLLNLLLLQHSYPITIVPPILRAAYIRGTAEANKLNIEGFYKFMADRIVESGKDYLRLVSSLNKV